MANITLKGNSVSTVGDIPALGSVSPDFTLVRTDLSETSLKDYKGKRKVLNIFPSLDTETCAMSVRRFNKEASDLKNTVVLNISADLPFAQNRFCGAEGIDNTEVLSTFRSSFGKDFNLEIMDSPLKGLCSRVVMVLDEDNKVLYTQQVQEITEEPDYQAALKALQ